jgi:hypothetical protein
VSRERSRSNMGAITALETRKNWEIKNREEEIENISQRRDMKNSSVQRFRV